jgi:hypothetical protein
MRIQYRVAVFVCLFAIAGGILLWHPIPGIGQIVTPTATPTPVSTAIFVPSANPLAHTIYSKIDARGVELTARRTSNSKTFLDGRTYVLDIFEGPIHYYDHGWQDINTAFDARGEIHSAPYDLEVYLTGMPGFHMTSKTAGEYIVRLDKAVSASPRATTPIIEGSTIMWPNLFTDTDVVIEAQSGRVTMYRIIKSDKAPLIYDVMITELQSGLRLRDIPTATDANWQQLKMETEKIDGGRRETLKLEPVAGELEPISYPITDSTTIDEDVPAGADDCTVYTGSKAFVNDTDYHSAGNRDSSTNGFMGSAQRFTTVAVPNSATIDTAYLTYQSNGSLSTTTCNTVIDGEDVDDATQITNQGDWEGRDRTTANVAWNNIGAWTGGSDYNSPEIKTVIQEIVDRDGWASGNAMQLFWSDYEGQGSDADARRDAKSYDKDSSNCPKLHIEYTEGATPTPTPTPGAAPQIF